MAEEAMTNILSNALPRPTGNRIRLFLCINFATDLAAIKAQTLEKIDRLRKVAAEQAVDPDAVTTKEAALLIEAETASVKNRRLTGEIVKDVLLEEVEALLSADGARLPSMASWQAFREQLMTDAAAELEPAA